MKELYRKNNRMQSTAKLRMREFLFFTVPPNFPRFPLHGTGNEKWRCVEFSCVDECKCDCMRVQLKFTTKPAICYSLLAI